MPNQELNNQKVYLDTNIVIDILDETRAGNLQVLSLLEYLIDKNIEIMISEDMLTTIFYIIKDKEKTLNFFKVIQDDWTILSFGKDLIENAIHLSMEKSLDLEDVLQCLCAKGNACEVFITNDNKFFDCGIKILTVKEFMKDLSYTL